LKKMLTLQLNTLIFVFILVDITSVAINCKFHVCYTFIGNINVKFTTVFLVINLDLPYGLGMCCLILSFFISGMRTCSSGNGHKSLTPPNICLQILIIKPY
jgi:hypothetical protein